MTLRVERFQTRPPYRPSDLEPEFAERIHSLDYLLYAEGRLIGQGRADDIRAADGNSYLFRLDTLPFGNYRLAFAANAAPRMMTGTTDAPELRYIVYQGEKGADDHFRQISLRGDMSLPQRVRSRTSARIRRDTFPLRKPACGDRIRGGFARQRRRAHAALRRSRPPVRGSKTHSRDRHGRTRRRHIYARNILHPCRA